MSTPLTELTPDFTADLASIARIQAIPSILDVICRATGMRFVAVARVTPERWIACSVLDQIDFGLRPGDELKVDTTICHEIRAHREPVIIDHVADDTVWSGHPTPAQYGFQSYISMPIILEDETFFGTLCAIDPRPARLRTPEVIGMFRLFAELIGKHLDADRQLAATQLALAKEREVAELRDQFIAVLGHDLRTPMRSINCLVEAVLRSPGDQDSAELLQLVRQSSSRMLALIENLLDLARGQVGGGLSMNRNTDAPLKPVLLAIVAELQASYPDREIITDFSLTEPVDCDRVRLAQLFSNLLGNALTYGDATEPVRVRAVCSANHLCLSVANAGKPIPASALDSLFQPFYRSAVEQNREGLGLGLYIAHQIAQAHRGTLEVESNGDETRFTFRMPLV